MYKKGKEVIPMGKKKKKGRQKENPIKLIIEAILAISALITAIAKMIEVLK